MTVSRFTLLIVLSFVPLTASGQVLTPAQTDLNSGDGDHFVQQTGTNPGTGSAPGPDSGANPPSQNRNGPQADSFQGSNSRPQPHYSTPIWQTTQHGGFFGMMGEIAQPGVYFHAKERVTLAEILKLAGGPTADASGGVRIVRQGRGGLQTFLSQDSRYELLNGDVVLLESRNRSGSPGLKKFAAKMQTAATGENRATAIANAAAAKQRLSPSSYLAFVNLMPEPIIVPVPGDQATLAAVMTWLRQDPKSPPFVRVISPSPLFRRDNNLPPEQQLLDNGTVLVFDSATVKHERLPDFPPVKGLISNPPPAEPAVPAAPVKTSVVPPPVVPSHQPLLQHDRPAGKATRGVLPSKTPPPPPEPKTIPAPRRGVGPQATIDGSIPRSSLGGPELLLPEDRRDRNPQANSPDSNSRPPAHSREYNKERAQGTTAASYEAQQLSWQSQPPVAAENTVADEFPGDAVVQAHGENGLANAEVQVGPALELPRPAPKLLPEPALIPAPSSPPTQTTINPPRAGSLVLRIVWLSLTGLLVLTAILWWISRRDRSRLVPARVPAGRQRPSIFHKPVAPAGRSVLMSASLPIRRTDTTITQPNREGSAASSPKLSEVTGEPDSVLPPPLRSISPREHALRAHFRQAVQERGKRVVAAENDADRPATTSDASLEPTAPAETAHVVRPPVFQTKKSSDVLDRALHVKRGHTSAD